MPFGGQQIDHMAFPAPSIKQEACEEKEPCFTSSPSIIQHEVSYATLDTSIDSFEGRIFIRSQPPSIMKHSLEPLASAIRKRSRERFQMDTYVGIKQEPVDMRPRKKLVTKRYQVMAPSLIDDFPNLRREEETPSPEPEEEYHPLYSAYAEAFQSQALHPGSASFNTTTRTIVETHFDNTSVPASNQDHCGSTPDFGDDYIPFDNVAQSEKDEDYGLFEAYPRPVSQHAKAHGISFSISPANEVRCASVGYTFSATVGSDQSVANNRQSHAEWNEVPSHGHNFVKIEESSSFDDADFGGEHDMDGVSIYAAYYDHQAQNVGPEYDQENIDPNTELLCFGDEPEPSRTAMSASSASRKRSLSQYADEYVLEVEASSGVRQKLNEVFVSPRNSFHTSWSLNSSAPQLRNNSVSRPFLRATETSARSRPSEDEDAERHQTAYSITTDYNPGWSSDHLDPRTPSTHLEAFESSAEQRPTEHATPPREQSGTPNNHSNDKAGLPRSPTGFLGSTNVYGAGFCRREFRYASPDAIHGHYIGAQAARSRESSVDVLERNLDDIERYERRAENASEEMVTSESSIRNLREDARHGQSTIRQSERLKNHWRGEARRLKRAMTEAKLEEGKLQSFVDKVEKARGLLAQAEGILNDLVDDDFVEVKHEQEHKQQWEPDNQWEQRFNGSQGGNGFTADDWDWLEGDGGY